MSPTKQARTQYLASLSKRWRVQLDLRPIIKDRWNPPYDAPRGRCDACRVRSGRGRSTSTRGGHERRIQGAAVNKSRAPDPVLTSRAYCPATTQNTLRAATEARRRRKIINKQKQKAKSTPYITSKATKKKKKKKPDQRAPLPTTLTSQI